MAMVSIEEEFRLLVGLVAPFEDLDLKQSEQGQFVLLPLMVMMMMMCL
jgi:hypothetical protein